jgi:protein involved in polysaccharide export with SLBB domain
MVTKRCAAAYCAVFLLSAALFAPQHVRAAEAPFASNLFQGNFAASRGGETPVLESGDRVVLRMWGERNFDGTLVVDARGNITLPGEGDRAGAPLGPIPVAGLTHDKLVDALKSKLAAAGSMNTQVYAAPLDTRPVAVFVTGGVRKPGRYTAAPADSPLALLDKAGGIDPERGSFRSIRLLRGGSAVALFDLYPFAKEGVLPAPRLHEGDTLVVDERGPVVEASGEVRNAARFEFHPGEATGAALAALAEPHAVASHVILNGTRNGAPYVSHLPLNAFRALELEDGDRALFAADAAGDVIMVGTRGAVRGTARFPVRRGAALSEVLKYIAVEPAVADLRSIYIKRKSVAERQKKTVDDALRRLEQSAFTVTSSSAEEAQIRAKEAEMISRFVERARAVETEGIVVLDNADLILEDGDIIVVPEKSDVVMVGGEVRLPQTVVWSKKRGFDDYIKSAGGYSGRADTSFSLIIRRNGSVARSDETDVMPGDQILVLPKAESKIMQAIKDVALVLYQVAVSGRFALGL